MRVVLSLAAFLLGALCALAGPAHATITLTNTTGNGFTINEAGGCPGGCVPVGTPGYIVNTTAPNMVVTAGKYRFTYLGAGDSEFDNSFTVAGGGTFCSQSFAGCDGGVASVIGASFIANLGAGDIPFSFIADTGAGGCALANSSTTNALPGTGCADYFVGLTSGTAGYIGLTDSPYPGDHDFQDLAVAVSAVPEPASMTLLAGAMLGMLALRGRIVGRAGKH
jgi:PEP-CTERM motif